jgi:hypothetical protein
MNINPPRTIALRSIELITCTVKPVLKGQLLDKEKVVLNTINQINYTIISILEAIFRYTFNRMKD